MPSTSTSPAGTERCFRTTGSRTNFSIIGFVLGAAGELSLKLKQNERNF